MKIEYNKLIRDRIPEIIEESGLQYQTEMLTEEKYRDALFAKLIEEAQEVATAPPDSLVAELADLYEVIDTILEVHQLTEAEIRQQQTQKRNDRGGFKQRLYLLWTANMD